MTAQAAAHQLLLEVGRPQASTVLAERMLKRGLVRSNASDPIQSLAQTIEKNIRGKAYNRPELTFVYSAEGRLIGLPSMEDKATTTPHGTPMQSPIKAIEPDERKFIEVSARLLNRLGLVTFAELAPTQEAAADLVITRGLDAMKDEIAAGMRAALATENPHPKKRA